MQGIKLIIPKIKCKNHEVYLSLLSHFTFPLFSHKIFEKHRWFGTSPLSGKSARQRENEWSCNGPRPLLACCVAGTSTCRLQTTATGPTSSEPESSGSQTCRAAPHSRRGSGRPPKIKFQEGNFVVLVTHPQKLHSSRVVRHSGHRAEPLLLREGLQLQVPAHLARTSLKQ